MNKRILVGLLSAILPTTAWAQPSYDDVGFGGVKIGASATYRWIDGDYRIPALNQDLDRDRGGFGYRGHIGFDMPVAGIAVIGAEVGLGRGGPSLRTENALGDYELKQGWNWDASGRIGFMPAPRLLLYGRGGYSWLRTQERIDFVGDRADIKRWHTESGFMYGAGVEAALSKGFYVRAEYNLADYSEGLSASRALLGVSIGF